jgi:hypothetical protein
MNNPMYCKRCFTALPAERPEDSGGRNPAGPIGLSYARPAGDRCAKCGKEFHRGLPSTYLEKPFYSTGRIVWLVLATTVMGVFVAMVVALAQMPAMQVGGH